MKSDDGDLAAPSFAIADSVTKTSSGGSRAADRAPAEPTQIPRGATKVAGPSGSGLRKQAMPVSRQC